MTKALPFEQIGFRDQGNDEWWCHLCGGESMDGRVVESEPEERARCVSCGAEYNGRRWALKCCVCRREVDYEDARQLYSPNHGTVVFCVDDYHAGVDVWLNSVAEWQRSNVH